MQNKVGGEVVSYCGKCKLALNHVIIAMDGTKLTKLRCNTCNSLHGYRSPNSQEKILKAKANKMKKEEPKKQDHSDFFKENMRRLQQKGKKTYKATEIFTIDDVVDHKTFGVGFVSKAPEKDRVEIAFESGVKLLVHGRT